MRCQSTLCALVLVLGLVGSLTPGTAQEVAENCIACHGALGDTRLSNPVENYPSDVHAGLGFSCVTCHGGDAQEAGLEAMDPARGYIGVPARREIPNLCGRCHSDADFMRRYDPSIRVDQLAEYRTSVHGHRLLERDDERVATCVGCHPAHEIKPPSDPTSSVNPLNLAGTCARCHADAELMAPYAIPVDQFDSYQRSVHWRMMSEEGDLSAPTCNDCHGNHGAAPPGVSWVGNVCGQCHTVMASLYRESFHSQIMGMLGNPGCATCHRNHEILEAGDELLGIGEGSVCGGCHTAGSRGGQIASEMRERIDSLRARIAEADSILARAEQAGMEVSQAQFDLNSANTSLVSARTNVHSFSLDSVAAEVDDGLEITAAALARGGEALDELQFRRLGLAVSVSIILVLIVGLALKIRQLEA